MSSDPSTWPRAPYSAPPRRERPSVAGPPGFTAGSANSGTTPGTSTDAGAGEELSPAPTAHPARSTDLRSATASPRPIRSVLFVCTGNVCRSPLAERLLRARAPHLTVTSRGTFSLQGSPMDADMAAELALLGGDASGFRSRQLAAADLEADLILVMGPEHLDVIRDEVPAARRRAGLLGHAGDLAALVAPGQALTTADVAVWSRARRTADGSIPDPYRRGRAAAARSAARIDEQLALLVPALSSPGAPA